MERGKRIEAELELPEAVIQHIQSFLNGWEAAQTTLVSKSWYAAWLTRPNLDFDQCHFTNVRNRPNSQGIETRLCKFMKKTVERYETLNLKIDTLRLWISGSTYTNKYRYSLVKGLIMKALKMGATALDFKISSSTREFILPLEVVFGSKNLVKLSLSGCKLGTWEDGKVRCSRLKSLTLEGVIVESDTIIWDIISSCPLIENLSFSIYKNDYVRTLIPVNVGLFNRLKSLLLNGIEGVDALFSHDFSSKFPCLKDLSLHGCGSYKGIQVSSPSLEYISFIQDKILRAKFDVPNIRKFTFSADSIPSVSFKTTSTNWRSDISIGSLFFSSNATWILEMNKLLTELSQSIVSLSLQLYVGFGERFDCAEDIKVLCKPEVENLMFNGHPGKISSEFLDALFQCCRPTYLTQDWCKFPSRNCDLMEFVYKRLMQHVGLECSSVCDLEEVDMEYYDKAVCAWRPRLLDASTYPEADKQRIRLHLKWKR